MDHIRVQLFSRVETQTTGGHRTHCAVQHWINVEVTFSALCSTIDLNSLKTRNLNY
jgi:hypothetical protein